MESERFQRAEELFHQALSQPAEDQAAFIQDRASGDVELAARVRRMIGYAQSSASTLAMRVGQLADRASGAEALIGKSVGKYELTKVIGEGGFGVVYEAQQEHPVRRSVALKIVRLGMGSEQVMARFAAERQALAVMDHPNIARVFDGGQVEADYGTRPYFVMELVQGVPITSFCDQQPLNCTARIELFITVCQAVQHAHQRGIIHRDLKPSNILVCSLDGVPSPKIIDFGIAKAMHEPLIGDAAVTLQRELLGTPQYMSPEQAGADARGIDTRTDIYSLGVILYELLTGSTPLEPASIRGVTHEQIKALIDRQTLERPSVRLMRSRPRAERAGVNQRSEFESLRHRLRSELDWIVMKAIDPDRERRYSSAAELADDLRRHLANQPVLAGPPSAAYRVRKFIRRHRVGVASAAVVALAILGGVIGTTLGMLEARDAAQQALAVNQFMRDVLTSADPERHGAEVHLVDVLKDASARASTQFAGHPELEADVRELLGLVFAKLARYDDAVQQGRQVVQLRRELFGTNHPQTISAEVFLARALSSNHQTKELEALTVELLPRVRKAYGPRHSNTAMVECLSARADMYRGRLDQAEAALRSTSQWVNQAFPADDDVRLTLKRNMVDVVMARYRTVRDTDKAERLLNEARDLATELRDAEFMRSGSKATSTLVAEGRLVHINQEWAKYDQVIEGCLSILERSEGVISDCHDIRTDAMADLGRALRNQGQVQEAAEIWSRRVNCLRSMMNPDNVLLAVMISDALPYMDAGERWAEGEDMARQVRATFERLGNAHGPLVFGPEIYLARFLTLQGKLDEALPIFERWLNEESTLTENHNRARLHLFYGGYLAAIGRYEEAERHIDQCRQILPNSKGTWAEHPDDIYRGYIALYEAWGKPEKAQEYRRLQSEVIQQPKSGTSAQLADRLLHHALR